jgi:putative hydrolase of HD superfamily
MKDFEKLHIIYKLKEIERKGTVAGKRYESAAEHTFSSLVLARYFLKKIKGMNEKKIMNMLMYHDLVEVYAGDTFILDEEMTKTKKQREEQAFNKLLKDLPSEISSELKTAWKEFEKGKTKEAKFCKAIEEIDPIIHSMHKPLEWKEHGFTEAVLRKKKENYIKQFPAMHKFFNELIEYLKSRNVIPE